MKKRKRAPSIESGQGKFKLPPDVSFHKQDMFLGVAYIFKHRTVGELGRVMVQPRDDGTTSLISEVVGDPADPMTQERARIFEPLGLELMERVAALTGAPPMTHNISPIDAANALTPHWMRNIRVPTRFM